MSISLKAGADNTSGAIQTAGVDRVSIGTDGKVSFPGGIAEFLDSNQSLAANGYQKLPGGLIIQWGEFSSNSDDNIAILFPIAFPNECFGVTEAGAKALQTASAGWTANALSLTGFNANRGNETDFTFVTKYFAIGY